MQRSFISAHEDYRIFFFIIRSYFFTFCQASIFQFFYYLLKFNNKVQTNHRSHFNQFYNCWVLHTTSLSGLIPTKKLSPVNQHNRKKEVWKKHYKKKRVISPLTNPYSVFVLSRLFLNPLIAHNILINKEQCKLVLPFV